MGNSAQGELYLVATPIGNLGDISERAVKTLQNVDFIAAEDTRVTRKLLEHLEIKKPLVSYYEHNRIESGEKIKNRILSGENCALVTDAGTPGISDPGEDLVRICGDAGIRMLAIPGPCAVVAALALSGLRTGRFSFEGFLSTAKKSRFEHLNELKTEKRTMVFFEAPHKLLRTLNDMLDVFGDRRITISREMTKIYEEVMRFSFSEAIAHFEAVSPRGEFVLVIEGAGQTPADEKDFDGAVDAALGYINGGLSVRDAAKQASIDTGIPRNALYNALVQRKE